MNPYYFGAGLAGALQGYNQAEQQMPITQGRALDNQIARFKLGQAVQNAADTRTREALVGGYMKSLTPKPPMPGQPSTPMVHPSGPYSPYKEAPTGPSAPQASMTPQTPIQYATQHGLSPQQTYQLMTGVAPFTAAQQKGQLANRSLDIKAFEAQAKADEVTAARQATTAYHNAMLNLRKMDISAREKQTAAREAAVDAYRNTMVGLAQQRLVLEKQHYGQQATHGSTSIKLYNARVLAARKLFGPGSKIKPANDLNYWTHKALADSPLLDPNTGQPIPENPTGTVQGNPPRVTNESEYNALPSGTRFLAPDGTTRIKP